MAMGYICLFSLFIFCTAVQGAFGNFVLFYLFKSTHAKIEREHSGGSEQEEEDNCFPLLVFVKSILKFQSIFNSLFFIDSHSGGSEQEEEGDN